MKLSRTISIVLLLLSSIIGITRGYRMTQSLDGDKILFSYPAGVIKDSVFTNYFILGWFLIFIVGIGSVITLALVIFKTKHYAYFIIIEGVFVTFLTFIHMILTGVNAVNVIVSILSITIISVGILQTPKNFSTI